VHCEEPSPKLANTSFLQLGQFSLASRARNTGLAFINQPSKSTIFQKGQTSATAGHASLASRALEYGDTSLHYVGLFPILPTIFVIDA
jgi:hypothetical protein